MSRAPVELHIGGRSYRVVASADEPELQRLAGLVEDKLHELTGGRGQVAPQSLLLVAIALAHELEEERKRRRQQEQRSRELLHHLLERVDAAIAGAEAAGIEPLEPEAATHQ